MMQCSLGTYPSRVAPVLKDAISAGKINLTSIINTHQYVVIDLNRYLDTGMKLILCEATGIMLVATKNW